MQSNTTATASKNKISMTEEVLNEVIEKCRQMDAPDLPAIARELFEKTDADCGEVATILRDGCDADACQIARALRDAGAHADEVAYGFYGSEGLNMDPAEIAQVLYYSRGLDLSAAETLVAVDRAYRSITGDLPEGHAGAKALYSEDGLDLWAGAVAVALRDGLGMDAQQIVDVLRNAYRLELGADEIERALINGLDLEPDAAEELVHALRY